ncbi:MAG: ThiF family adenylyltransferase [Acidimicrobiales bacterium]|nr:ThiF family adenylyltransferase [Acidimicrobiales bacterium]
MSALGLSFAAAREAVIDGLCSAGFSLHDDGATLTGDIDIAGTDVEHEITLPDDFPVAMPKVRTPLGEGGLSWHREPDGHFCLWSEDEAAHLPWLEADTLIDRVKSWHAMDAQGWPDDPPDLDLERYWPRQLVLVTYPDLDELVDRRCKVVKGHNGSFQLVPGKAARKKRSRVRDWAATIVDVGEIERPIHNFDELANLMSADEALALRTGIEDGTDKFVVVRYQRHGHEAVLVLIAFDRNPHDLRAAEAAHDGESTLMLRAGLDASVLADKRIAIVGVGAVGCQVAEMLVRSGAGELTLVDGDLIRPGNCIRHVATLGDVGRPKADAVRDHLVRTNLVDPGCVTTDTNPLRSATRTEELLARNDLVLDCTANGPASALLLTASRVLGRPVVSVCLQRNGTVARVDRSPLREGEKHDAAVEPGGPETDLREGGCGDPVSPTPPWACSAAAARAVAMAADLLSGRNALPPSVVDTLIVFPSDGSNER